MSVREACWDVIRSPTAGERAAFERAAQEPAEAQQALLQEIVARSAPTLHGQALGLKGNEDWASFRAPVPMHTYNDLAPWIEAARLGAANTLGTARTLAFECTSGSSGATKWIPYSEALWGTFHSALCIWMDDLLEHLPSLPGGSAYFALSPVVRGEAMTPGGIPVGLPGGDLAYLGPDFGMALGGLLIQPAGDVPNEVEAWRRATLAALLADEDQRMLSVWSSSFISVVLRDLFDDSAFDPARPLPGVSARRLRSVLSTLGAPHPLQAIWPKLALVSCWADGESVRWLPQLRAWCGTVPIQGKGLLSTEAKVSSALHGGDPVAARQHSVIELLAADGTLALLEEAKACVDYEVVVTTTGGLLRYRTGDHVHVTGWYGRTPRLRFLGRGDRHVDRHVDLCGEKLSESFVLEALGPLVANAWVLVADADSSGYTLICRSSHASAPLDEALRRNVHYDYARRLVQLRALQLQIVRNWEDRWGRHTVRQRSVRLGDIKPPVLLGGTAEAAFLQDLRSVEQVAP